ncbi:uncharacterized protein LOC117178674 [Belonocnema kinseyi]|uniref:uncharacterized protein LOC117178674 n=1 Tax=Belonocnema kinseyi TaxID=2817044 RepID=UPI00143D74F8|nr:uncharacterized protein LOC117178674 [Belonocnema kinseyi]
MAFTGIAATLLPEGKKIHKTLGLPVPLFSDSSLNIKANSRKVKKMINTDIFIWYEAPMSPRYDLEVIDRNLRDLMKNDLPFGGKIVVLGGHFRQLLPVKENAAQCQIHNSSIKFSAFWTNFIVHHLIKNMRALPEKKEFSQFLLQVAHGTSNNSSETIQIPEKYISLVDSDIVRDTYKTLIKSKKFGEAANYTILSARNIDVHDINRKDFDLLDEETEQIYTSIDSTKIANDKSDINHEAVLPKYLNLLNPPSLSPHELRLRKYTVVMLIRNRSISAGLCNRMRLLILDIKYNALRCKIFQEARLEKLLI